MPGAICICTERGRRGKRLARRERAKEGGGGRSVGKRGQGLLMALIVQTKSETIHLHNKRPSRSHSRSRSCPVFQLQLQSNFQVQLQVQVQVQLRMGVAQHPQPHPHPHPRCRRAADYLNSRCGRLMSAKAANVRCSWRRSRRLSLAREVAMWKGVGGSAGRQQLSLSLCRLVSKAIWLRHVFVFVCGCL